MRKTIAAATMALILAACGGAGQSATTDPGIERTCQRFRDFQAAMARTGGQPALDELTAKLYAIRDAAATASDDQLGVLATAMVADLERGNAAALIRDTLRMDKQCAAAGF